MCLPYLQHKYLIDPFWKIVENYFNPITGDAVAPHVASLSTSIWWIMNNKQGFVVHKEGFQLPAVSQFWEVIDYGKNVFVT